MNKVVITRPYTQGQEFARILSQGVDGLKSGPFTIESGRLILEPLLRIETRDFNIPNPHQYDGVIITSGNAIQALHKIPDLLKASFFCVGKKTAEDMKKAGAENIVGYADTIEALLEKINADNNGTRFLYLRGAHVSFDIKDALKHNGIIVDEAVCYEAMAADHFSQLFLDSLEHNEIGLVTLFSKRTAEIYVRLIQEWQNRRDQNSVDVRKIHILCISQPVLKCVLNSLETENAGVAKTPDMRGMVEAVHRFF